MLVYSSLQFKDLQLIEEPKTPGMLLNNTTGYKSSSTLLPRIPKAGGYRTTSDVKQTTSYNPSAKHNRGSTVVAQKHIPRKPYDGRMRSSFKKQIFYYPILRNTLRNELSNKFSCRIKLLSVLLSFSPRYVRIANNRELKAHKRPHQESHLKTNFMRFCNQLSMIVAGQICTQHPRIRLVLVFWRCEEKMSSHY